MTLVFALEVTLCVRVPDEYAPSQLTLVAFAYRDTETVVEVLGPQVHRALSRRFEDPESFDAVAVEDLAERLMPARMDSLPATTLSWFEFDEVWKYCVDPSLPIRLTDFIPRWLRRKHP